MTSNLDLDLYRGQNERAIKGKILQQQFADNQNEFLAKHVILRYSARAEKQNKANKQTIRGTKRG